MFEKRAILTEDQFDLLDFIGACNRIEQGNQADNSLAYPDKYLAIRKDFQWSITVQGQWFWERIYYNRVEELNFNEIID